MAALEIHNVRKEFGSERVLKDVSISIDSGEFLILVGPSGCGKSTFAKDKVDRPELFANQ